MGFIEDGKTYGPISIPDGLDLTPETQSNEDQGGIGQVVGAAFRLENPIISALSSYDYDPLKPFDPEYRPWDDIQGTDYETYATRFTGARDRDDVARMKMQIDREIEDRRTLDAAGVGGFAAQMGAAVLSPTSLIPGGVVVKGTQGVRIGLTSLSVAAGAGVAAGIDEAMLHGSQQTRTGEESAFAIGGSVILGGILGAAAGTLSRGQFRAASAKAEELLTTQHALVEGMREAGDIQYQTTRSVGAADASTNVEVRGERAFQALRNIPFIRGIVRSDPILRTTLSQIPEARRVAVDLIETPMQFKINAEGQSVRNGEVSVETRIKDRERNQLVGALDGLGKHFADYWNDGPVGRLGTITAPLKSGAAHLARQSEKLTSQEFMIEVGRAMRRGDKHPIPQVQSAADMLRRDIFDPIKDEAIELGIFDEDLGIKNAASYFSRVYNQDLIRLHDGDGSDKDIRVILREEFKKRRAVAQENLAFDRRLDDLEADQFQQREAMRGAQRALDKARKRATEKRERAKAAVGRETAVGRATGALRRIFEARQDDLEALLLKPDERAAMQEALKDARGLKRLRPRDILEEIRGLGGIKDKRVGNRWTGRGWAGDKPTDIEQLLDTQAVTIRRKDGKDIDEIRELLEEGGYLEEGSDVNDLLDAIGRAGQGEDVFSRMADPEEVARYEAAQEFAAAMDEIGVDISKPLDKVIAALPGKARNAKVTKGKSQEAGRSGKRAGESEDAAAARVTKAIDRLEEAQSRLRELNDEVGPKVREEIKAAQDALKKLKPQIKAAKKAKNAEEFYAAATDLEIDDHVLETVRSLTGLKNGQPSFQAAFANPTRARVLDVADEVLEPWLVDHAGDVMGQYFRSMVPQLELVRKFGDLEMSSAIEAIERDAAVARGNAKTVKERKRITTEAVENVSDIKAMRDRMMGNYGVPENPRSVWVQGGRVARTVSFMGLLGGMTLSAIPDVAGIVGRAGIDATFGGAVDFVKNPKRLFRSAGDMAEMGASGEWFLNSRAMSLNETFDPYGSGTKLERVMAQGATHFSVATGMIPWNFGWKSVGGSFVASRMAKAADRVRAGKATKKDLRFLGANDIEPWMAERIANQIDQFGDKNGFNWLPNGKDWDDAEAFAAMRHAMNREMDLMVVTPGQDKPLSFSTEAGKFFLQFKSFAFSSHHRILLSGIQKADADVLAQVTTAIMLGALVSNIKADMGGYDRKEGTALWEDAIDRSGLAGWLMEPYNIMAGATAGRTSISGESVSRYQSRSVVQGMAGPSLDLAAGVIEASNAFASGNHSYRDVRKLMKPIPGNNLVWLLGLFRQIEEAAVEATGARPRQ